MKAASAATVCAAVEPLGCEVLAGQPVSKARHLIQGTSYGAVPPHWDASLMDLSLAVTDEEAKAWRRTLAVREDCTWAIPPPPMCAPP